MADAPHVWLDDDAVFLEEAGIAIEHGLAPPRTADLLEEARGGLIAVGAPNVLGELVTEQLASSSITNSALTGNNSGSLPPSGSWVTLFDVEITGHNTTYPIDARAYLKQTADGSSHWFGDIRLIRDRGTGSERVLEQIGANVNTSETNEASLDGLLDFPDTSLHTYEVQALVDDMSGTPTYSDGVILLDQRKR